MYEEIKTMGHPVARVLDINGPRLMYIRKFHNGQVGTFQAYNGMKLCINDHLITDKNTVATVEFAIGGAAGIGKDTEVVVLAQRQIRVVGNQMFVRMGQMWAKMDKQKQQLQIQTSGGVTGREG